jgi:hypothetical protein
MIPKSPTFPATLPQNAPPAFHILSKPTGAVCNFDCKYCFFLSKEILYPGSHFRMADEVMNILALEEVEKIKRAMAAQPNDPCPCGSGKKFRLCHGQKRKP